MTSKSNIDKINKLIIKAARLVLGDSAIGRIDAWTLKQLNWLTLEEMYQLSISKIMYRFITTEGDHYMKTIY